MEIISSRTIEDQSLEIDDKSFIDCTFINCILEYSGRPVNFERTMMRGCRYVFFGEARSTVHFLQGIGLMPHEQSEWAEFSDTIQ